MARFHYFGIPSTNWKLDPFIFLKVFDPYLHGSENEGELQAKIDHLHKQLQSLKEEKLRVETQLTSDIIEERKRNVRGIDAVLETSGTYTNDWDSLNARPLPSWVSASLPRHLRSSTMKPSLESLFIGVYFLFLVTKIGDTGNIHLEPRYVLLLSMFTLFLVVLARFGISRHRSA